jgi:uroporphyrinogen decarboxylase
MAAMINKNTKLFLKVLNGKTGERVPFWFMRQAGRYLPEYRELRKDAGSFLDLVYNPQMAAEVTLQPIRRYGMDGAILFSDILVIPHALGQVLRFEEGRGPILEALTSEEDFKNLNIDNIHETLLPIYETVKTVRKKLETEKLDHVSLIGFSGSPWTVICYMIEGGSSKNFAKTKNWANTNPESFSKLVDLVTDASILYLSRQIEAGAEIIQLFDSWAGLLEGKDFEKWVIKPTAKIVSTLKSNYPNIPIIGFPRQGGEALANYAENTGINGLGLDYSVSQDWAVSALPEKLPLQGNLHPETLLAGGNDMEKATMDILNKFSNKPHIFNLGHGIIKETPPENVQRLCEIIRNFKA